MATWFTVAGVTAGWVLGFRTVLVVLSAVFLGVNAVEGPGPRLLEIATGIDIGVFVLWVVVATVAFTPLGKGCMGQNARSNLVMAMHALEWVWRCACIYVAVLAGRLGDTRVPRPAGVDDDYADVTLSPSWGDYAGEPYALSDIFMASTVILFFVSLVLAVTMDQTFPNLARGPRPNGEPYPEGVPQMSVSKLWWPMLAYHVVTVAQVAVMVVTTRRDVNETAQCHGDITMSMLWGHVGCGMATTLFAGVNNGFLLSHRASRSTAVAGFFLFLFVFGAEMVLSIIGTAVVRHHAVPGVCQHAYAMLYASVVMWWVCIGVVVTIGSHSPAACVRRVRAIGHSIFPSIGAIGGTVLRAAYGPAATYVAPLAFHFVATAAGSGSIIGTFDPDRNPPSEVACYRSDYDLLLRMFWVGAGSMAALLFARTQESRTDMSGYGWTTSLCAGYLVFAVAAHADALVTIVRSSSCAAPIWNMLLAENVMFWAFLLFHGVFLTVATTVGDNTNAEVFWRPFAYSTIYRTSASARMASRTLGELCAETQLVPSLLFPAVLPIYVMALRTQVPCSQLVTYLEACMVMMVVTTFGSVTIAQDLRLRKPRPLLTKAWLVLLHTWQAVFGVAGIVLAARSEGTQCEQSSYHPSYLDPGDHGEREEMWKGNRTPEQAVVIPDLAQLQLSGDVARITLAVGIIFCVVSLFYQTAFWRSAMRLRRLWTNVRDAVALAHRLDTLTDVAVAIMDARSTEALMSAIHRAREVLDSDALLRRQVGREKLTKLFEEKKKASPDLFDWNVTTTTLKMLRTWFGHAVAGGGDGDGAGAAGGAADPAGVRVGVA